MTFAEEKINLLRTSFHNVYLPSGVCAVELRHLPMWRNYCVILNRNEHIAK